ncbi:hypothetical protein NUW58_g7247 [Xylaria curta]|uniref:Uncharacterized protein n=1 Tax=Xylaria curta TaxID=42375 RepID=A0ACC1NLN8_9PEZI|nr:hypothetical protein NUW58_g7247 [Xylaria curta]
MASKHEFDASSEDESNPHLVAGKTLPWFGNPVIYEDKIQSSAYPQCFDELQDLGHPSQQYNVDTIPRFEKRGGSSALEVFYDLWFVANVAIFTTLNAVNNTTTLWSYVAYISLLWVDWFLVTLYDVRYLTDSVVERVGRAVHMSVMVGFAVVFVDFTLGQQSKTTFQVTSLALAVSRLSLAARYCSVVWRIRYHTQGKYPLIAVAAINFISVWIYFGISFGFTDDGNSHAFISWYVVSVVETLLQFGLSLYFNVLSFDGTHLTERMTVSTLFMLGEGVNVLAENVVTIVQNNGWTPATIGNLTSGVSNVYFVFMVYFDWMANHHSLSGIRQSLWVILHFPFHILLLLFMEGSTQFVQWWKILEALQWASDQFSSGVAKIIDNMDSGVSQTQTVVNLFNATVTQIFEKYKPTSVNIEYEIDRVLETVATIPNEWWSDQNRGTPNSEKYRSLFDDSLNELSIAISNSILVNFKIDPISGISNNADLAAVTNTDLQTAALQQTSDRFTITFQFTFISAGLTLLLMTVLFAIGRPRRSWSISVAVRMALFVLLGVGLSLVAIAARDEGNSYQTSPWLLPTLALVYFLIIIITRFPRRPTPSTFAFWQRARARGRRTVKEADVSFGDQHMRHDHLVGVEIAYEGHKGQPMHASSYPLGAYREQNERSISEKR